MGAFAEALKRAKDKGEKREAVAEGFAGVVTNSAEFQRILDLPRRALDLDQVLDLTPVFARDGGGMQLRPIQSAALMEAHHANGLFAPIGVGHGKTLITLLLPEAMESERTVLLVPPQLRDQLDREIEEVYGPNFNLPLDRIVRVLAYSELSLAKNSEILDQLNPDLIIADEAHKLKAATSSRTKRFLRYMREHPECRFAGLSGTMTTRSVLDYAHLIELALRKNSPLPNGYREVRDWAGALDVEPRRPMKPGVLMQFCEKDENHRQGYRRRLVETGGVVATAEGSVGTSLYLRSIEGILVPSVIGEILDEVKRTWSYAGEEFSSPLELSRFRKQIASGFYYRWIWPNDEPDEEWLEARREWKKAVREKLKQNRPGLDSELLCANAAERWRKKIEEGASYGPDVKIFECPEWIAWTKVKDRYSPTPPTETVWVSDFLVRDVLKRAGKYDEPLIIWYNQRALGERLAEESRWAHYGAGVDASEAREPIIICSVATQATGKNLQHYSRNLITSLPPNGMTFEQLAGRTHRPGQKSDEVYIDYYAHVEALHEAREAVRKDAQYIQDTTGQKQKFLYATHLNPRKIK